MNASRRDFLRVGGLGLCGVDMLDMLQARTADAKAKHMIVCWLGGGPPHTDMFDLKPNSPEEYRGLWKPIQTNVTGLQVGELLPELAKRADKYTVIRSVTTENKPGDHARAPLYWNTGNPRLPTGTDEYPMYGSVVNKLRPGPKDLPTFAVLDEIDVHTHNELSRNFMGSAHSPFIMQPLKDKDAVTKMLTPQLEVPAFESNANLLKALDTKLRRDDRQDEL